MNGRPPMAGGNPAGTDGGGVDFRPVVASDEARVPPSPASPPDTPPSPPPGADHRLHDTVHGLRAFSHPVPSLQDTVVGAASRAPVLATLLMRNGARKGDRIPVRSAVVGIGRAESSQVHIPEPSVSQHHATLSLRDETWILEDVGSTNGTFVQGERVLGETVIAPGATLRFGEVTLLFETVNRGVGTAPTGDSPFLSPMTRTPRELESTTRTDAPRSPLPTGVLIGLTVLVGLILATLLLV